MTQSIFFDRHSGRSYFDKPIPQEVLDRILERVRWSPSCGNAQPWRLVVIRDPEQKNLVMAGVAKGNQWMAKAPVIVAICGRKSDDHARTDNPVEYYQFDCGMATLSLLLGATEEGLMAHPTAGWDAVALKQRLALPEEFHIICLVSLGYEGTLDMLDEATRKKSENPRTRKEMAQIVSYDKFQFS
jgi:nitroreductase